MKWYDELSRWRDELLQSDASDDDIIRVIKDRIEVETDEKAIHFLKSTLARLLGKLGDESASDALYRELLPEVDDWYRKLRRTHGRAFSASNKAIEDRIRANPEAAEVDDLYRYLSADYSAVGDHTAAEAIERLLADKHPDDPGPLNSLAFNKCSLQHQPEEAMPIINRALEIAHRTGELRRYTLGQKARIALDLKRYDIVEGVLREIMQLKIDPEVRDIGRERDFFDRLPPNSIDPDVARQYNEYCLAVGLQPRRNQGPPHEPPEWSDPEEGFDPGR
jgi:tetratricopeptide (TPR) repeat protein